jgi:hypothetical protein
VTITAQGLLQAAGIWVLSLVLSLVLAGWIVVSLPPTYFKAERGPLLPGWPAPLRWLAVIVKNLVGLALIALGLVLSIPAVPGQGVLTMLIGLMLMDFPGKHRLERRLLARPGVVGGVNRLRAYFGRPPLVM